MSTNNSANKISVPGHRELQIGSSGAQWNQFPDSAALEVLANECFPEFFQHDPDFAELTAVQTENIFSEEEFLQTLPGTLQIADVSEFPRADDLNLLPGPSEQFSFFADARSIFADSGNVIASPKTLVSIPGFLPGIDQLEAERFAGGYQSIGIAPVIIPAIGFPSGQFDVHAVRKDFPILAEQVNGKKLIWLDNAATTHKPQSVINRLTYFYEHENSNVHRGAHTLAARATDAFEDAREKIGTFINASSAKEIVFVRGTTEAINLVAQSWGKANIQQDDEIIVSLLEHHANIVPWQIICDELGAKLRVIPVDETGQLRLDEYEKLLGSRTKIVAVTQVSNALGTITPVAEIVQMAHRYGAKVLVDGAQAVAHLQVDVQALDCDFYVFSGHKAFGPTGIGVLYGKSEMLNAMRPYQGGGNMIVDVTFEKTVYQVPPYRFEAGTGNIADAVGLGTAIDYMTSLGMNNINAYEHQLLEYGMEALQRIPGVRLIGTAKEKASVLSFVLKGFTTEAVGKALNQEGIAVRAGHHCAQPILRNLGLESTIRPSLAFYNTREEIDVLAAVIRKLKTGRSFG